MKILLKALFIVFFSVALFSADKVFTSDELAQYNGKDGNPAYVAVDGVVYDVTGISYWKNGTHAGGRVMAGTDASQIINSSPHGKKVLKKLKVVGSLQ